MKGSEIEVRDGQAGSVGAAGLHSPPSSGASAYPVRAGVILNADDWGRDRHTTDRILDVALRGSISSTSAMVFMEDSERAAELALEHDIDAGIHINMTTQFSAPGCSPRLMEHQERLARFLTGHMRARMVYRPDLAASFDYVFRTQLDEYQRLYGLPPHHLDGHHHMHLCENVLLQRLIPREIFVRRSFTFFAHEKGPLVRGFRWLQARRLSKLYQISDYFFDILPLEPAHLQCIFGLGAVGNVEIETHPALDPEYNFLMGEGLERSLNGIEVVKGYDLRAYDKRRNEKGALNLATPAGAEASRSALIAMAVQPLPHICICICTFRRPERLRQLLMELRLQKTEGRFTWSVVVVDNDADSTSEAAALEAASAANIPVRYLVEPERGIARARNMTFANAEGDYLALIDDDELPKRDWLLRLYKAIREYDADGVLGPVLRQFDHRPPSWLEKSSLLTRRVNPSGMKVAQGASRTGNVFLKRSVVAGESTPFRVELRAGEDQDFFDRKIREGYHFVWSSDAVVFEVNLVGRSRWQYIVRRTLLQGASDIHIPSFGTRLIAKSVAGAVVYAAVLPFTLLCGTHRFMEIAKKLTYHTGRLLMAAGINPVREAYATDAKHEPEAGSAEAAKAGSGSK